MNTEHCSRNFKNYSQQISLFSYIQFFGLIALTPLEPSTSLTPYYAVPSSLCRRTLARCFAATPHVLSLVSTRIPPYPLAWDGSLAIRCIAVRRLHRHPLLARFVSVRRLPVGRLHVGRLTVHLWTLAYRPIALSRSSIVRLCRCDSLGNVWYTHGTLECSLSRTGTF
jgi:hypothetical protein